jgi:outer membrane lipoprotein-sorting protein
MIWLKMKNTSFLITAALLCASPLVAQEVEATVEPPVPASSELAQKAAKALVGSKWKSKFDIATTSEMGDSSMSFDIRLQDLTHFAIGAKISSEDPFEGEIVQEFTLMCDGEFLYANSDNMAEMTGGMMNGPIKVEVAVLLQMLGQEEAPSSDFFEGMVDEMLGEIPLKEEGSTDKLRRYTAASDEDGTMTACFYADSFLLASIEGARSEGDTFTLTASDSAIVEEFEEGTFTFVPAEGVVVTDITAMLQMQMGGPPAPADEDLEF